MSDADRRASASSANARVASTRRDRPAVVAQLLGIWDFGPQITQNRWAGDAAGKNGSRRKESLPFTSRFAQTSSSRSSRRGAQYLYRLIVTLLTQARATTPRTSDDGGTRSTTTTCCSSPAKVLRENGDVRRALQQKYRWLFVDEFQDTDPVQAEIMFLLAADDGRRVDAGSTAAPPTGARAAPSGALFVVGDPKQSIYRFRRADIDIYNEVRARLTATPTRIGVVSLTTNFRSVPALCEWANEVFATQFPSRRRRRSRRRLRRSTAHRDAARRRAGGVCTLTIDACL